MKQVRFKMFNVILCSLHTALRETKTLREHSALLNYLVGSSVLRKYYFSACVVSTELVVFRRLLRRTGEYPAIKVYNNVRGLRCSPVLVITPVRTGCT